MRNVKEINVNMYVLRLIWLKMSQVVIADFSANIYYTCNYVQNEINILEALMKAKIQC